MDGRIEAQLTLLACSDLPEGRSKWTVRLLADKLVEMEVVDSISHMSVQRLLKKMALRYFLWVTSGYRLTDS